MKKLKPTLIKLPEYYMLAGALLYGYSPAFNINPIAVVLIAILSLQIIYKNKISGFIMGSLLFILNIGMLAAGLSEFREFPTMNANALQLLSFLLVLFVLNLTISGLMLYKHGLQGENPLIEIR